MTIHSYLLDLPEILEGMGFNVEVADRWEYGQCDSHREPNHYLWTNPHTLAASHDGQPWAYMVHHSGTSGATPPPAKVSKGGAWIGLWRNGKLYQEGGGTPTIYLASAGPARTSSGFGYKPAAWVHTFNERRAPAAAEGSDGDIALNRFSFNAEVVHRGNGSPLDRGVLEAVAGLGVALEMMTGLKEMTLGHRSWTERKIDPYWNNDRDCIIMVQDLVALGGNVDPNCPWTGVSPWKTNRPQCNLHYVGKKPIEWGVNTGVCNIHDWAELDVQKMIDAGRIKISDNNRDDGSIMLNDERYWVFEGRAL